MLDKFFELMHQIGENPMQAIFLILSVVLLEVILSVDNAAVLATMVKNLPPATQKKALSYGIIGAYVFRGVALIFASVIIDIWWLKPIGGAYLMWMAFSYFRGKATEDPSDDLHNEANQSVLYKYTVGILGTFWSTVLAVEFMDIVFSIDNIFAAVAMSDNIILIIFGVFIGILAMRFVAQRFVKLMEKYPIMETSAFIVIGLLGIKLFLALVVHYVPSMKWIESEAFDMTISGLTLAIFFIPVLWIRFTLGKAPDTTEALLGSSKLDAEYTLGDGSIIQLGTIVQAAFEDSGLTVAEWNAQTDDQREARIWNKKNEFNIIPEGMYEHTFTEDEIAGSETLREFGFSAGSKVRCFINPEDHGHEAGATCVAQHERTIKRASSNEITE